MDRPEYSDWRGYSRATRWLSRWRRWKVHNLSQCGWEQSQRNLYRRISRGSRSEKQARLKSRLTPAGESETSTPVRLRIQMAIARVKAPMNYGTLPSRLLNAVDSLSNPRAQMFRAADGWQSISSEEFLRRVAGLST